MATGHAERDPAADLRGALAPVKETHYAIMTDPKAMGALLTRKRAIDGYRGHCRPAAPYGWHRLRSFGPANCRKPNGQSLTWTGPSGISPQFA